MTTQTATIENLTSAVTGNVKWLNSPWDVYECVKCNGSGKYKYSDGATGACYPCEGLGLIASSKCDESEIASNTRYVSTVTFDKETKILSVYYIGRDKGNRITPFKKSYDTANQTKPGSLENLRNIYKLANHKN